MNYVYINLSSAIDRKRNIERCFNNASLNFHRFEAIYGKDSNLKINGLNDAQIGCYLSHLLIVNSFLESQNHLVILEDDSFFDSSINLINELTQNEKFHWDIIYLDATFVEINDYIKISRELYKQYSEGSSNIFKLHKINDDQIIFGTHGYIINKKSIKKISDILTKGILLGKPIDNIYCQNIRNKNLNSAIILPTPISPSIDTTISQINENDHPLMNDWIKFRNLISFNNINKYHKNNNESFFDELYLECNKIIANRLKFSFYGEFLP